MKKNIYTTLYNQEERNYDLTSSPRIKKMIDIINRLDPKEKKILDVGCYDGTLLGMIKNKNNELFGLEASEYGVIKCLEKGIRVTSFFFDDVQNLPYEDKYFDIVLAGEIIEHIYDTDFFLAEIARVLKPGGYLLLSTPNVASLGRRIMLALGKNPIIEVTPNEKDSSGHIRYFIMKTLEGLLTKHDFKTIIKISDTVNFSLSGRLRSSYLAKIMPSIGSSLIILSRKTR